MILLISLRTWISSSVLPFIDLISQDKGGKAIQLSAYSFLFTVVTFASFPSEHYCPMSRFSHVLGAAALVLLATTTSAEPLRGMGRNEKRRALGPGGGASASAHATDEASWLWSLTAPPGSRNFLAGHQPLIVPTGPQGNPTVYQVICVHHSGSYLNAVDIPTGNILFNVSISSTEEVLNAAAYGNKTLKPCSLASRMALQRWTTPPEPSSGLQKVLHELRIPSMGR